MNNIALVGYNNTLAKSLLELMALRGQAKENIAVFEANVLGEPKVSFGEEDIIVRPLEKLDPAKYDAVIFASREDTAARHGRKYAAAGTKVVNATAAFAGEEDIPVLVGGVNDDDLSKARNIISVPRPPIVQLLSAVAGLVSKYTVSRIRLSAYVSADIEGQDGMSELYNQTRRILMNDMAGANGGLFHKTLAFNVIPQAGAFIGEETSCEWEYNTGVKQVLGAAVKVHANCAVVPAFVGLGQFANIETVEEIDADEARDDIKKAKGVLVLDKQEDGGYVSLNDVQGESSVFVSRVRQDMTVENGISLWIAGDVYKIAAQNILAVLKQFLKKGK